MINIILLGPPGSGKSTQSKFIIKKYNLCLISLGNILRNKFNDEFLIKSINKGNLINDNLVNKIIKDYIFCNFNKNGYLFDGFPRNILQAKFLNFININFVIELFVSNNIIIDRLLNRKIHLKSGRSYNIKYNPPKVEGLDDITGEKLVYRKDDLDLDIIKKRLFIYNNIILNLRNYYKNYFYKYKLINNYILINVDKKINLIKKEIINLLSNNFN